MLKKNKTFSIVLNETSIDIGAVVAQWIRTTDSQS